jgi:5-(carboxyamino)imidazole ribonucleotide mutase
MSPASAAPLVAVVLGSDSDLPQMEPCLSMLEEFEIGYDLHIRSAHRTPDAVHELATTARQKGYVAIIAAAGGAAHLAGVIAASTTLPVLGVPMRSAALSGVDSLYSTVQMPAGVPVPSLAIGEAGAANAAIFVAQMVSVTDPAMAERVDRYRASLREKVQARHERSHRSKRFGASAE